MVEAKAPRTTHELVCVGLRLTDKKKLVPVFNEIVDGRRGKVELSWDALKAHTGNVYQIEAETWEEGGSHVIFVPKGGRLPWLRLWPNAEDRALWEAAADTTKANQAREKLQQNAEKQRELVKLTEPLAVIFRGLAWGNRTAFLIHVQELILRHPTAQKKGADDE